MTKTNFVFSELRIYFPNEQTFILHPDALDQLDDLIRMKHKIKAEELIEGLIFLNNTSDVFPKQDFSQIAQILVDHHYKNDKNELMNYSQLESLPYNSDRGYGGVNISWSEGGSTAYVVGSPKKILPMCKNIYDPDEFLRLNEKWQKSNFQTTLITSRDDEASYRNSLIRGLKNSLNIIALVGIR